MYDGCKLNVGWDMYALNDFYASKYVHMYWEKN